MNETMTFELSKTVDGVNTIFTVEMSTHASWPDLLDHAILPGLRAMGYTVNRSVVEEP